MANALQLRRGTTTEHASFTGLVGEVTVDTTKDTVVVHDGSTAGGFPLAKFSDLTVTNVTNLQTSLDAKVDLAGDTMTGFLTLHADPTANLHAATKQYVDTIAAAGIHYHSPVRVEAPSNLNATYDNGSSGVGATLTNAGTLAAITIDGVALSSADRVLVYNQTNAAHNGIYTVTTVGDGSTAWVLTRATDADSYGASDKDALGEGDAFFVLEGDTGAGELYVMNTSGTITFGTTGISFEQIAATAVYSAGTGLDLTGTVFSIDSTVVEVSGATMTGTLAFNDNVKATFGTSADLEIYHDGTNSIINDAGTGSLVLQESGGTKIEITSSGIVASGNISVTGTVDGRDLAADGTKLDGIESGATADQTITAGAGLTGGGTGDVTIQHADTSTQASVDNSGNTFIQDITLDTYGHITALTSATAVINDATVTVSAGNGLNGGGSFTLNQSGGSTVTLNVDTDLRDGITHIGLDTGDYIFWSNNAHTGFVVNGGERVRIESDGDLHADGDVIAYSTTISDPRLKSDIQKIEGALDKLCTLSGYTFTYTPDNTASAGILSTEVAKVLPSAIRPKKLPLKTGDEETVYDTVQYDQLHGLLIEAIKELREEVAELKAKIEG